MARGKRTGYKAARPQRLTIDEARTGLHTIVGEFRDLQEPSRSLLDRAVEVGPRRQGGLLLIPEIDARAAVERIEELEAEVEEIGALLLIEERRASASPGDYRPLEELVRLFGREDLLVPAASPEALAE